MLAMSVIASRRRSNLTVLAPSSLWAVRLRRPLRLAQGPRNDTGGGDFRSNDTGGGDLGPRNTSCACGAPMGMKVRSSFCHSEQREESRRPFARLRVTVRVTGDFRSNDTQRWRALF